MSKTECLAMILAGGKGSRLKDLTKNLAKPGVLYGGKYRIIDFPLSNCSHSGIKTVGILTQYQPLELNWYIGNGSSWDLDTDQGGTFILQHYLSDAEEDNWYQGTADAIYQNINFINMIDPEYVLILSGDHIYSMNYRKMLEFHKKNEADVTVATLKVPWKEASRFGIMKTDDNLKIVEFQEKPEQPKSNKASMGIYIFSKDVLEKYLKYDAPLQDSEHDFGKNIIPKMLEDGISLYAYPFEGYWKDVGTIDSLWEANMDMLRDNSGLDLNNREWRIYSGIKALPPHYIGEEAVVKNSVIGEGALIEGNISNSVIFYDVVIEQGAEVKDSVIMPGTIVKAGAKIQKAIIGEKCIIEAGSDIKTNDESVFLLGNSEHYIPEKGAAEE